MLIALVILLILFAIFGGLWIHPALFLLLLLAVLIFAAPRTRL